MQTSIIFTVAFFAVAFLVIVFVMSYIKAAPDEAIIVSGLRKLPKVIIGRAGLRIPFFERADHLSLQLIQIDVKTGSPVPTKDYINVSVDAVVTAKISDNPERLKSSAQNFLNKKPEDIRAMIQEKNERHTRLVELQNAITLKRNQMMLGRTEELLVEKNSVRDETELRGRTDNFKKVVFKPAKGHIVKPGDYVRVKLDDIRGWTIRGKLIIDNG